MSVQALPTNLPVGFRFHPTDQELISHFLKLKINGEDSKVDRIIAEVDFCKWEPWDLPSKSRVRSGDKIWWFFCRRDYKYASSTRAKRRTKAGFWKITGKEREIKGGDGKACIGKKKTLVFYKGTYPGKKTNWVMQEYYVESDTLPDQFVICRLKEKSDDKVDTPNGGEGEPSTDFNTDFEDQRTALAIQGVLDHTEVNLESISQPDWYTEHEMDVALPNGFTGDYNFMQAFPAADESDDQYPEAFVESLIVDPDEDTYGNMADEVYNISCLQRSSKRTYYGPVSSDTDIEGAGRYFHAPEKSSMFGPSGGSKKVRHMRMVKAPSDTLKTSTGQHSRVETVIPVCNQFFEDDASSDDLTEHGREINSLEFFKEEVLPRYAGISRGGHHRRVQAQKKVLPTATQGNKAREAAKHSSTVVDMSRKEKSTKDRSENSRKMVQSSSVEKHSKLESCESPAIKWKIFLTFEEASALSHRESRPPSEYCFNAVVGTILFVVFVRELLLYGSWC